MGQYITCLLFTSHVEMILCNIKSCRGNVERELQGYSRGTQWLENKENPLQLGRGLSCQDNSASGYSEYLCHVSHPSLSRSRAKKNLGQEIGYLKIGLTVTQHRGKGKDVFMSMEPIKVVWVLVDSVFRCSYMKLHKIFSYQ